MRSSRPTVKVKDLPGRKAPTSKIAFPGFGALLSWLTALDLAHAGVVEFPTVNETCGIIREMGKGAMAGLVALGGLPNAKASLAQVTVAVVKLDTYLSNRFTDAQLEFIVYNVGMEEHGLCKYSRLKKWVVRR